MRGLCCEKPSRDNECYTLHVDGSSDELANTCFFVVLAQAGIHSHRHWNMDSCLRGMTGSKRRCGNREVNRL